MKKKLATLLVLIMALSVIGCSKSTTPTTSDKTAAPSEKSGKIETAADLKGKTVAVVSSASGYDMKALITSITGTEPQKVEAFDRYSDCIAAVAAGKADAFFVMKFVGNYYAARNNNIKLIDTNPSETGIIMAMRPEDQKLKNDFDKAIATLKENGTLKRLEDEWITNLPANNEPSYKEPAKIEGAKTIYVGISGDLAPLDYIAADGKPAGYNVALLSEIGKLIGVNFEFVTVQNKARFAALASKKIDVIFIHWASSTINKDTSWIGTVPYFTSKDCCLLVKK